VTDQWTKRQRVWRHNSFRGQARLAEINLRNMLDSDSLTYNAKTRAIKALFHIRHLLEELKTRKD
jgi:hypothetical protein